MTAKAKWFHDERHSVLLNEKGTVLKTRRYICFGNILEGKPMMTRKTNPVCFYEHYFVSNLDRTDTKRYLTEMKGIGLFRNVKAKIVKLTDVPEGLFLKGSPIPRGSTVFKMRADVRKCSPQEYQFVGFVLRDIVNAYNTVLSWFHLLEKHPDKDKFQLYLIAHNIDLQFPRPRPTIDRYGYPVHNPKDGYQFGHCWLSPNMSQIVDTTIPKLFAAMDVYARPFLVSMSRGYHGGVSNYGGIACQVADWNCYYTPKLPTIKLGNYSAEMVEYYFKNLIKEKK